MNFVSALNFIIQNLFIYSGGLNTLVLFHLHVSLIHFSLLNT